MAAETTSATSDLDARAIANLVMKECWKRNFTVTHLKLQKLLFLCQVAYFTENGGRNLIKGEFEAWEYGPVHRLAYIAFKDYEKRPITEEVKQFDPVTGTFSPISEPSETDIISVVNYIVRNYGEMEPFELVRLTHAKDGPWDSTVKKSEKSANIGMRITNDVIRETSKNLWFGDKPEVSKEKLQKGKSVV